MAVNSLASTRSLRSSQNATVAGSCVRFRPAPCRSSTFFSSNRMTVSPARRAAFEILRRVEQEGAYASILLAALDRRMREEDRALCHELVLGILRKQLWLDRALEHFANREVTRIDLLV